jgi:hypothetical protein
MAVKNPIPPLRQPQADSGRDNVTPMVTFNGTAPQAPTSHKLAGFQARYMKRLVANFERAKASVDAAQNAANDFIVACSEEAGIQVGVDGWTFDIDSCEFVKVPQLPEKEE